MKFQRAIGWSSIAIGIASVAAVLGPPGIPANYVRAFGGFGGSLALCGVALLVFDHIERTRAVVKAATRAELIAHGLPGKAVLTDVRPTGTQMYNDPQIQIIFNVLLPGRHVYQVVNTEVMPESEAARYQAGATFSCQVAPDDPGKVLLVENLGLALLQPTGPIIIHDGIGGTATVFDRFRPPPDAEIGGEGRPYGLKLRIEIADGRPAYDVTMITRRPAGHGPPRKGQQLPAAVHPEDPRRLLLRWPDQPADDTQANTTLPPESWDRRRSERIARRLAKGRRAELPGQAKLEDRADLANQDGAADRGSAVEDVPR